MKKITVFGSPLWAECKPVREYLLENKVEFDYIDITDSMRSLKIFLAFRDKDPYFDPIKKRGSVGIPTIMIGNGEKFLVGSTDLDLDELK